MKQKGFTLIELLVVIAIIGILASVVLTQVNSARDKTLDVAIKGDLDGIRAASVVLFDSIGNKYSSIGSAVSGDCTSLTLASAGDTALAADLVTPKTIFLDKNINLALNHIKKSNGNVVPTCGISSDGGSFAIVAQLKSAVNYICLDGTGQLKTTTGTGSVPYPDVASAYNSVTLKCN